MGFGLKEISARQKERCFQISKTDNTVKTVVETRGPLHTAASWTLESSVVGVPEVHYTEQGRWDGQRMLVKGRSFSLERETSGPLIDRWSLLPLLASGKIKQQDLKFDLLDESTLRPNQTLRYMGEVTIPVAGGETKNYVRESREIHRDLFRSKPFNSLQIHAVINNSDMIRI